MIKNIIFDWQGVVADALDLQLSLVNQIFREWRIKAIDKDEFQREWEMPHMLFYNKYDPTKTFDEQNELYVKFKQKAPLPSPVQGMPELVKRLYVAQRRMFVLSTDNPKTIFKEIDGYELSNVFEEVCCGVVEKIAGTKDIINKHNLNKAETIIVGDSLHEIEAGKANGIMTAGVTWGMLREDRFKTISPDYIFHTVAELEKVLL